MEKIIAAPVFLIVSLLAVVVLANYLQPTGDTVATSGVIAYFGLEIYEDSGLSKELNSISWGSLEPGSSTQREIYVHNERDYAVQLGMSAYGWSPVNASDFLFLTWDYQNQNVGPNQYVHVFLNLTVSPEIHDIEVFNFTIAIYDT